ncbi:hypothetical protein [Actinophytocola sp.]|uniref:hypothetical protein n=1 Tax=Actinophytocola sp. TaxID=1872138 RepID=UPI002ED230DA
MSLLLKDIEFRTELPDVPASMPLAVTDAQTARERAASIAALADLVGARDAIEVELPFGHALASKAGQVEFFSASGAIRGRNASLFDRFDDERREWSDVEKSDTPDGVVYRLGERSSRRLIAQSRDTLERIGLTPEGVTNVDVVLGQWAQLDDTGEQLDSGPGRATVRMGYEIEKVPLIGPGAKTHLHYDPIDGSPVLARFFHVLRSVTDVRSIETGGTERAFDGLLADPFLAEQSEKGGRVAVTAVRLGLLALPADLPQRFAQPALAVEGVVEGLKHDRKGSYELRFGRYVPAVTTDALRAAGVAVPTM